MATTKPRKTKVSKPAVAKAEKTTKPPIVKALADQADVIAKHTPKPKPKPAPAPKEGKSSVVKHTFSIPTPLFNFAVKEAKRIAKLGGKEVRPNLSAYVSNLIFAAKHAPAA